MTFPDGRGGTVTLPSPATCALSGTICQITVTGGFAGSVTIRSSYPGDSNNAASSGTASVMVSQGATTTSLSCTPPTAGGLNQFEIGLSWSCTASVSGGKGTISGEAVSFSQTGGTNGSVTFPSPVTCTLSTVGEPAGEQTGCQITVTGSSVGSVTIQAAYVGDTANAGSSGNTTINVMLLTTAVPSIPITTTTTSSSASTVKQILPTTSTSSTSSSGGLGSAAYLILAALAVIVVVFGVVMWRRRVAGDYRNQPVAK